MSDRVPAEVFPPGEYLRDELEARGWTQTEFAEIIGRPTRLVNELIAAKRAVTPETAGELAAALGTSPMFWLNLEAAYQLKRARQPDPRIAKEAKLRERFPVRDMVRRGWVEGSDNADVLEARILHFYNIQSVDETPRFAFAAKRVNATADLEDAPATQIAWLVRVRQIASALPVAAYSEAALRNALDHLRRLVADCEEIRHVPRILAECGVRFVIVEPLPSSKIDGACLWLSPSQPVIGMSLRFDRIDSFWFVLRHEIEHVLRGDGQDAPAIDVELDRQPTSAVPEQEVAANAAAAQFCVSQADLSDFIARVQPFYPEARVTAFARRIGVHPGLVVGQLQRKLDRYDLCRKLLVKVRHLITPVAVTDGYGSTVSVEL